MAPAAIPQTITLLMELTARCGSERQWCGPVPDPAAHRSQADCEDAMRAMDGNADAAAQLLLAPRVAAAPSQPPSPPPPMPPGVERVRGLPGRVDSFDSVGPAVTPAGPPQTTLRVQQPDGHTLTMTVPLSWSLHRLLGEVCLPSCDAGKYSRFSLLD
jgi:hypothetical protein